MRRLNRYEVIEIRWLILLRQIKHGTLRECDSVSKLKEFGNETEEVL